MTAQRIKEEGCHCQFDRRGSLAQQSELPRRDHGVTTHCRRRLNTLCTDGSAEGEGKFLSVAVQPPDRPRFLDAVAKQFAVADQHPVMGGCLCHDQAKTDSDGKQT
jgi:hypothetical protein